MTDAAHEPDFALTTPADVASDPNAVEIQALIVPSQAPMPPPKCQASTKPSCLIASIAAADRLPDRQ